jgi:peptide/nickel transport system permease protein
MPDQAPEHPTVTELETELIPSGPSDAIGVVAVGPPGDVVAAEPATVAKRSVWRELGAGFWVSSGFVVLVVAAAILAPVLPIQDPNAIASLPKQGPSIHHLLGTDDLGRDLLARTIWGARVSLVVGFASVTFGFLLGGALALAAGYYRGAVDGVLSFFTTVILAFPALVLALAVITFLGRSLLNVTLVIGFIGIPVVYRIVRANTLTFSQREFVLSARSLGASNKRILVREILPNVLPAALALSLVGVAVAIVTEGALAFLGLSVPPPTPTWGGMIAEGLNVLQQDPWISLVPAFAMLLLVLSLNFAGDRLRSYFDVREGVL